MLSHIQRRLEIKARVITAAVLLITGAVVAGCQSNPDQPVIAERIVVQAATLKLIDNSSRPAEKAARIMAAVDLAQTLLLDTSVTVDTLRAALLKRVAEQELPPAERLLAIEVVNAVSADVEIRLGKGLLSPDAIVSLNTVLSWVESTAGMYVQN